MFILKLLLLITSNKDSTKEQTYSFVKVFLKLTFLIFSFLSLQTLIKIAPTIAADFDLLITQKPPKNYSQPRKRPPPPPRIPPNKVKPGGGLNLEQKACSTNTDESLVALVPVDNPVLTTKADPSFLFYVPDTATNASYGEFSLLTADEKVRLYSTVVTFGQTPGIIKVSIPASLEYALEENRLYRWYFRVYCQNTTAELQSSLDVNGWIKRVSATMTVGSESETISENYWYDAIAESANNLMATPQSFTARNRWLELLEKLNLEHLADYPLYDMSQE